MIELTPEQRAYAHGYFTAFVSEGMADNVDTDYETWFGYGDADFNLHFVDGLVVVDVYKVIDGLTRTNESLRMLTEDDTKVEA